MGDAPDEVCRGLFPASSRRSLTSSLHVEEQKRLFEDRFAGENFEDFASEAERFDLTPLLGNPEFLHLFGLAYLQNDRRFSSKLQIYSDAAKRLAKETNEGISSRGRPDAGIMVKQAGSIFVRLLLSGASGLSLKERIDDRNYPYVGIVGSEFPMASTICLTRNCLSRRATPTSMNLSTGSSQSFSRRNISLAAYRMRETVFR